MNIFVATQDEHITTFKNILQKEQAEGFEDAHSLEYRPPNISLAGVRHALEISARYPITSLTIIPENPLRQEDLGHLRPLIEELAKTQVSSLILSKVTLNRELLKHLTDAIKKHQKLSCLVLESNQLKAGAGEILAEVLQDNPILKELFLGDNGLRDEDIEYLLPHLEHLETLDLDRNRITDVGTRSLAPALELNTSLLSLSLAHNELTCISAINLGEMLTQNQHLKYLDISQNSIDQLGINALKIALRNNQTLTTLCVYSDHTKNHDFAFNALNHANNHTLTHLTGPTLAEKKLPEQHMAVTANAAFQALVRITDRLKSTEITSIYAETVEIQTQKDLDLAFKAFESVTKLNQISSDKKNRFISHCFKNITPEGHTLDINSVLLLFENIWISTVVLNLPQEFLHCLKALLAQNNEMFSDCTGLSQTLQSQNLMLSAFAEKLKKQLHTISKLIRMLRSHSTTQDQFLLFSNQGAFLSSVSSVSQKAVQAAIARYDTRKGAGRLFSNHKAIDALMALVKKTSKENSLALSSVLECFTPYQDNPDQRAHKLSLKSLLTTCGYLAPDIEDVDFLNHYQQILGALRKLSRHQVLIDLRVLQDLFTLIICSPQDQKASNASSTCIRLLEKLWQKTEHTPDPDWDGRFLNKDEVKELLSQEDPYAAFTKVSCDDIPSAASYVFLQDRHQNMAESSAESKFDRSMNETNIGDLEL